MKRILKVGIYKRGGITSEVIDLDDVKAHVDGKRAVFTGHATVTSRFKGEDFSGFYRLTKVYERRQERWQVVASRTARVAESQEKALSIALERGT